MIASTTNAPLPDRDEAKPATEQGLFRKYDVRRVDGVIDPAGAEYFVLRVDDPLALPALAAYAHAAELQYPVLAAALRARFDLDGIAPVSETRLTEIRDRVVAALARIEAGHAPRRIPADPTDVDLVLSEMLALIDGRHPPFWIRQTQGERSVEMVQGAAVAGVSKEPHA